jgi:hypothetical protein
MPALLDGHAGNDSGGDRPLAEYAQAGAGVEHDAGVPDQQLDAALLRAAGSTNRRRLGAAGDGVSSSPSVSPSPKL